MGVVLYSKEEVSFVLARKAEGVSWFDLCAQFNGKFKANKSIEGLRHVYKSYRRKNTESVTENKEPESKHPLADFTKESLGNIIKVNDFDNGVFFITSASPTTHLDYSPEELTAVEAGEFITSRNVHEKGFAAVKNFCARRKAELIVMPLRAHVKALKEQPRHYDPVLKPHLDDFATEYTFNSHLKAIEVHLNPQQINPLTGLKRLHANRGNMFSMADEAGRVKQEIKRFKSSLIIAHSKQMMEVIPTGNSSHPRIIHSTGSITRPAYLRNRIGMVAEDDHILGGLIVEIHGSVFYLRQVQIDPIDGSFVDIGTRYHADGSVESERAEAFKMGDIHPGFEDPVALNAWYDIWSIIKPKRIFMEDFFDGCSITHHMVHQNISRQKRPGYFKSLTDEISYAKEVLDDVYGHAPKDAEIVATASNHPEHLTRYLEEGRYINDDVNFDIAHRMVVMALDGKNPLQEYLDPNKKMLWLGENDDYFVEGVQLGAHGHLGINGAKGGKNGQELAYGNAMTAHTHSPCIWHQLFTVGHSSQPRHGYNKGANTWILCSGAVYRRGQKQLYMVINGNWRLPTGIIPIDGEVDSIPQPVDAKD